MMLFGKAPDANVDGAPIVNGVTVVIKAAEMAKLKRLGVSVAAHPAVGFALAICPGARGVSAPWLAKFLINYRDRNYRRANPSRLLPWRRRSGGGDCLMHDLSHFSAPWADLESDLVRVGKERLSLTCIEGFAG